MKKRNSQTKEAKVEKGHVRKWKSWMFWKESWRNCSSPLHGWIWRNGQTEVLRLPNCQYTSQCQFPGCYPVILVVSLKMARVPGKYLRPHYLAIWNVNPKYGLAITVAYVFQGRKESPYWWLYCSELLFGALVWSPASHYSAIFWVLSQSYFMALDIFLGFKLGLALGQRQNYAHSCFCYCTSWDGLNASVPVSSQLTLLRSFPSDK